MKFIKKIVPLLMMALSLSNQLFAQEDGRQGTPKERQLRTRDDMPLRDFVESKENVEIKEKASHLEISGDVRFEWGNFHEKGDVVFIEGTADSDGTIVGNFEEDYLSLRGGDARSFDDEPISNNDWDVDFNFKLKYTFDRAWAAAHLQYDNSCGIRGHNACSNRYEVAVIDSSDFSFSDLNDFSFSSSGSVEDILLVRDTRGVVKGSGSSNAINLKRAYMGYNVWADGVHRIDIEAGRRKLDDIFTSEIEFSSRFDGMLVKYATSLDEIADLYVNAGGFVIDERTNHLGWAAEIGFLDVYDTGLDVRYSFIDWTKRGRNRCFIRNPLGMEFQNSQISFSYNFEQEFRCHTIPMEFYGGFLVNHAAKKTIFTNYKKKNLGWYVGLYIGDVRKKGDWAFDMEYFVVQAQAVSENDVGGPCRGNTLDEHLNDILIGTPSIEGNALLVLDESNDRARLLPNFSSLSSSDISSFNSPTDVINVFLPRRGNTNYIGYRAEFLYAITDNLSIDAELEISYAEDKHIGGRHRYTGLDIELIYAF